MIRQLAENLRRGAVKTNIQSKPIGQCCRERNVAETCLLATWLTSYRRHEFYSGLVMEQGKSCRDEETQGKGTSRGTTCEAKYR
jgi:hypothetical protein